MASSEKYDHESPPPTASDVVEHKKRSNTPALLVRRSSMGGKLPETVSSAYVLDWEDETCRQRLLSRAEDLLGEAVGRRRLTVIQGLPLDLVQILRDSLGVDPGFLEAHAGRRRHRPLKQDHGDCFVSFEYPELVKVDRTAIGPDLGYKPSARQSDLVDVMDEAPFHSMSRDGQAVIFCHASLWMSSKADILFLDRPIWNDPSSQLRKARRPLSVARSWQTKIDESQLDGTSVWNVLIAEGDEFPGLEDSLLRNFRHTNVVRQGLPDVLADAVYGKWLDLFETLPQSLDDASLFWQATESLEQNLDEARNQERRTTASDMQHPDWRHLLDRLQRRVTLSQMATTAPQTSWLPSTRGLTTAQPRTRDAGYLGNTRPPAGVEGHSKDDKEANQRALDRVTYLGGILLPFTVVSAILSMNEQYSPNGSRFWVFWVASVAAVVFSLLIIYLDQLRGLEVYFDVTAASAVESAFSSGGVTAQVYSSGGVTAAAAASMPQSRLRRPSRLNAEILVDMPQPGVGDVEVMADSAVNPTMLVQACSDGRKPKAWQRGRLGWGGAIKKVVGYYRWRGRTPMQLSSNGLERFRMENI
ncbi:hypothetical protein CkaCkLH20_04834 [Colletotrichum karsti]|uniref:Cysteine protease domain-containing protein n=1 Tax=Colletotrichum karsti TaxID=1095194 RepID=A0A9P6I7K8_9PEZI|nr:uncharacterized protein CkaCkLH20_04834 [Colletotrichum karsti]KAF9877699.1 hypothetical protein CkaCkLH20_04834 [Colletotrichum karsti]